MIQYHNSYLGLRTQKRPVDCGPPRRRTSAPGRSPGGVYEREVCSGGGGGGGGGGGAGTAFARAATRARVHVGERVPRPKAGLAHVGVRRGVWHESDLVDVIPLLARDEERVGGGVIRDAVEHVVARAAAHRLALCRQQPAHVDPAQRLALHMEWRCSVEAVQMQCKCSVDVA